MLPVLPDSMRYSNILHNMAAEKILYELKCNRMDPLHLGFPNSSLKFVDPFAGCKHTHAKNTQKKSYCIFLKHSKYLKEFPAQN